MKAVRVLVFLHLFVAFVSLSFAAETNVLRVGEAGHAFDHLGDISDQARAAVMSGANIIYSSGFGALGYEGLPEKEEMEKVRAETSAYLSEAKSNGVRLAIGYVCATSIVKIENFDHNWSKEFRAQFSSPPAEWLQQDRNGKQLTSWYGGDYRPACMNNPDWRAYEKFIVRQQLEAGNDGIFFDNPTVHPQGCYCPHCMTEFAVFLNKEGAKIVVPAQHSLQFLRKLVHDRPKDFMRFRCNVAADFLAEMRSYARTIKPDALVTCNNSLNAPDRFFTQCHTYGYNIFQMSKAEDWIVVEDQVSQPRTAADGTVIEYGPVYEMLRAISHQKPVVASTLAEYDDHTAPNLMRLAMAEAAAHNASYLSWPTWPENQRMRMISDVRPQADLLWQNAELLNNTETAADAFLFFPFRLWTETADCQPLKIARALTATNMQFQVVSEDDFPARLKEKETSIVLIESPSVLIGSENALLETFKRRGGKVVWTENANWMRELQTLVPNPAVHVDGPASLRVVVHDQPKRRVIHLLNLDVQRISSYEDTVKPVSDVHLQVRLPFPLVHSVRALSADAGGTQGLVPFKLQREQSNTTLDITIPRLFVSTILVIE